MDTTSQPAAKPKQPLPARLGFFVLGGIGSAAINNSILEATKHYWGWSYPAGYAFSASCTAVIFFFWSYFVNFRTSIVWKNCLGRYLACVLLALGLNITIGHLGLKDYAGTRLTRFLVIVCTQSFTGGIKFLLYHFWVFPHAEKPAVSQAAS